MSEQEVNYPSNGNSNDIKQFCMGCSREMTGGGPGRPYCPSCEAKINASNNPPQQD
jgi:hypothetical protein